MRNKSVEESVESMARSHACTESRTVGLMKPMGALFTARRASFMAERMAATTGVDADVPYTSWKLPVIATT